MKYFPTESAQCFVTGGISSSASILFSSFTFSKSFDTSGFSSDSMTRMERSQEYSNHPAVTSISFDTMLVPVAYGTYYSSTRPSTAYVFTVLTSTIEVTDASPTYTTCAPETFTSTTQITDADPTYTTCVEETLTSTTQVTDADPTYTTCVEVSITDADPTYTECSTYTACSTYTGCSTYTTLATDTSWVAEFTGASPSYTATVSHAETFHSFASGTVEFAYLNF